MFCFGLDKKVGSYEYSYSAFDQIGEVEVWKLKETNVNGFFFYAEFPDKKSKRKATRKNLAGHSGTVVAINTDIGIFHNGRDYMYECISSVFDHPNSQVCGGSVSPDYLRDVCLRISEKQARLIHPALFEYLDAA